MLREKAADLAEERREEMVSDMMEMSLIPSVNPRMFGQGEFKRVQWIEKYLTRFGIPYITVDVPDSAVKEGVRRSLVVKLFPGKKDSAKGADEKQGEKPDNQNDTLWIIAHVDTVNAGDRSAWRTDPFVPVREGDRIYGLGCEDNSQAVICALHTARIVRELGLDQKARCSLGFIFASDEETGSTYGLHALAERGIFSPGDEAIVPDAGSPDGSFVEIAEKSQVWLKFTVEGRQAHASMPQLGINAASVAARLGAELEDTLRRTFDRRDSLFGPPCSTFELTQKFENVESPNILPGKDQFVMDLRILPCYRVDQVMEQIRKIMNKYEASYPGAKITVQFLNRVDAPDATPKTADIVQCLKAALEEDGVECRLGGIGGGTCAAILRERHIPAVVWSTLDDLAHQPNEYVNINNLVRDTRVYLSAILKYCQIYKKEETE